MLKLTFLFMCSILAHESTAASSAIFKKLTLPANIIQQNTKLSGKYYLSDCVSLCLTAKTGDCDVVIHEKSDFSCSFGRIVLPPGTESKIFSKEKGEENDLVVYGKGAVIGHKSGHVPVLLSMHNFEVSQQRLTLSPGVSGDPLSTLVGSLPLGESAASGIQPTLVVLYGNLFVSCGGVTAAGQTVNTCRYLTLLYCINVNYLY